ncbi:MAG: class I SAM-dependent methyltransferase [Candidatus Omnitrophota bacterium]
MKNAEQMRPPGIYDAVIRQREIDGRAFAQKHGALFVAVSCPACGNKGEESFSKFFFQHNRCSVCRTVFCTPRPPDDLLGIFYNEYEAPRMWTELLLKADVARKALQYRPRVERIIAAVKDNGGGGGGLAVDVGAGSGAFAVCIQQAGFFEKVVALDISSSCVEACQKQGLSTIQGSVRDIVDGSVDLLTMNDLIEHVFDPLALIGECHRALKKGGFLSIATPNGEGFDFKILKENTGNITPPEHLTYFNPVSLPLLLERGGFRCVAVETPGKLDVEIVLKETKNGFSLEKNNAFLGFLFEQGDAVLESFQQFLVENRLSSHMLVLAQKR